MNKKQLIEALKALGVEAPKGATNPQLEELLKKTQMAQNGSNEKSPAGEQIEPPEKTVEKTVTETSEKTEAPDPLPPVKPTPPTPVIEETKMIMVEARSPIYEGGVSYSVGEVFETSEDRALALGELVDIQI